MRKSLVLFGIFFLISSVLITLFAGASALAADAVIEQDFGSLSTPARYYPKPNFNWDLTRGDLSLSYTVDMTNFNPLIGNGEYSEVGIIDDYPSFTGRIASMSSGAVDTTINDASKFYPNDQLCLHSGDLWENSEWSYDTVLDENGNHKIVGGWPYAGWDPRLNCGIWFDRGSAPDSPFANLYSGKSCNTGGRYDVVIKFHALDSGTGVMFATVNGVPTGFWYQNADMTANPSVTPVGKSFRGDMAKVKVFANLVSNGVAINNIKATGSPAAPTVTGVSPNSAEQGEALKGVSVYGTDFRPVTATLKMKNSSGSSLGVSDLAYIDQTCVSADVKVPTTAPVGPYTTYYSQSGDPTVATLANSFKVTYCKPVVNSLSADHSRPNKTVSVYINGKNFRRVPMTVRLQRGIVIIDGKPAIETIEGKNVTWISSTRVRADFTISAKNTIASDWALYLQHSDDGNSSILYNAFSVDARMDINAFTSLNVLWLRFPGLLSVTLYSEPGFDAISIFPLAVSFGKTFPIACNPQDVNHDGLVDQIFYFNNMAVNLPKGTNNVSLLGASWDGRRIKAWDTVRVFWFLF